MSGHWGGKRREIPSGIAVVTTKLKLLPGAVQVCHLKQYHSVFPMWALPYVSLGGRSDRDTMLSQTQTPEVHPSIRKKRSTVLALNLPLEAVVIGVTLCVEEKIAEITLSDEQDPILPPRNVLMGLLSRANISVLLLPCPGLGCKLYLNRPPILSLVARLPVETSCELDVLSQQESIMFRGVSGLQGQYR